MHKLRAKLFWSLVIPLFVTVVGGIIVAYATFTPSDSRSAPIDLDAMTTSIPPDRDAQSEILLEQVRETTVSRTLNEELYGSPEAWANFQNLSGSDSPAFSYDEYVSRYYGLNGRVEMRDRVVNMDNLPRVSWVVRVSAAELLSCGTSFLIIGFPQNPNLGCEECAKFVFIEIPTDTDIVHAIDQGDQILVSGIFRQLECAFNVCNQVEDFDTSTYNFNTYVQAISIEVRNQSVYPHRIIQYSDGDWFEHSPVQSLAEYERLETSRTDEQNNEAE